jgi:hypothetical protein
MPAAFRAAGCKNACHLLQAQGPSIKKVKYIDRRII